MAPELFGPLLYRVAVVDFARAHPKRQPRARGMHHQMQCEAHLPPHGAFAPRRVALQDWVAAEALGVPHHQRGRLDKGDAGAAALSRVPVAASGDPGPGHQVDKAAVADQVREVRAQMALDRLGVIRLDIAVGTAVERDDDGHHFTETQLTLAPALARAVLEQTLGVDRLKDLAKVIDITDHSDERAHQDRRWMEAALWSIPPPYAGPYGRARPARLARTEVILRMLL